MKERNYRYRDPPLEQGSEAGNEPRAPAQPSVLSELLLLLMKIVLVAVFLIIVFTFFFGIYREPDNMMSPAIKEGDLVIYYRLDREYVSGDVVMVENRGDVAPKRVVATGGDSVDITKKGLTINGYVQQEKNIYSETLPYKNGTSLPVKLSEGQVFVLGDNRSYSEDSRNYGPVETDATKGHVLIVIRRRGI